METTITKEWCPQCGQYSAFTAFVNGEYIDTVEILCDRCIEQEQILQEDGPGIQHYFMNNRLQERQ